MTSVDIETTETKQRIASHEYLDATGNVVENEEDGQSYRFTLFGVSLPFDWQWSAANEAERIMLALFGAKTLATNEASAKRNSKQGADVNAQMEAVIERFALLRSGQWVDRTREPGAVRIDKDALAEAICRVLVEKGKKTDKEVEDGYKATIRAKLEDDRDYVRKSRQIPEVAAHYSKIVGKTSVSVDDLLVA